MQVNNSTMQTNPGIFESIDIFQGLSTPDRSKLAKQCVCRFYKPDEQIISYKARNSNVFFIVSGRVQAINYSVSGQQTFLQDFSTGQMFGELSAIDGQPRSACVVAITESMIVSMTSEVFRQTLHQYPSVVEKTLRHLTNTARYLSSRVFEKSTLSVSQQIRAELIRLASHLKDDDNQAIVSPALTHAAIANHVGASRETVTREMARMRKAGLITRCGTDLIIRDIDQLHHMI